MYLSAAEGQDWQYEVCEHADGYIVLMRHLETGELEEGFATVFRTMPVALAFAEMAAARDRHEGGGDVGDVIDDETASSGAIFLRLSGRLQDEGIAEATLRAYRKHLTSAPRRTIH